MRNQSNLPSVDKHQQRLSHKILKAIHFDKGAEGDLPLQKLALLKKQYLRFAYP